VCTGEGLPEKLPAAAVGVSPEEPLILPVPQEEALMLLHSDPALLRELL